MANGVTRLPTAQKRYVRNPVLNAKQLAAHGIKRLPIAEVSPPAQVALALNRSPELLICMALYKALSSEQRCKAMEIVRETYEIVGDEDSRIASDVLAAISLTYSGS